jgi:hypothetical protein
MRLYRDEKITPDEMIATLKAMWSAIFTDKSKVIRQGGGRAIVKALSKSNDGMLINTYWIVNFYRSSMGICCSTEHNTNTLTLARAAFEANLTER